MSKSMMSKVGWIIFFIILWQILSVSDLFPKALFPSPVSVLVSLLGSTADGTMPRALAYSLELIGIGLLLGISLALIMSVFAKLSPVFASLVETCLSIAHPLPGIALLPLVILWVGVDSKAIIFIILHSVLWPLVQNLRAGFLAVPEVYLQVGYNMGLSPLKQILYISLPASLPYFLSGLEISWARAWRSLVSAEMIFGAAGGVGGIGWLIFKNRVFMDTPGLFASLSVMIVIGILVESILFRQLENRTIRKWGMYK